MRWKPHVRFGKRVGETDQPQGWRCAPARLHQVADLGRRPTAASVFGWLAVARRRTAIGAGRRRGDTTMFRIWRPQPSVPVRQDMGFELGRRCQIGCYNPLG